MKKETQSADRMVAAIQILFVVPPKYNRFFFTCSSDKCLMWKFYGEESNTASGETKQQIKMCID